MWSLLLNAKSIVALALGVGAYFIYGWGYEIINNYGSMAAKIERLERDKKLLESRDASNRIRIQRRDDAIAASKCKTQIEAWIKDPDSLPGFRTNPFDPNAGG